MRSSDIVIEGATIVELGDISAGTRPRAKEAKIWNAPFLGLEAIRPSTTGIGESVACSCDSCASTASNEVLEQKFGTRSREFDIHTILRLPPRIFYAQGPYNEDSDDFVNQCRFGKFAALGEFQYFRRSEFKEILGQEDDKLDLKWFAEPANGRSDFDVVLQSIRQRFEVPLRAVSAL